MGRRYPYIPTTPKNILDTNISVLIVKRKITLQCVNCSSHGIQDTLCDNQWLKNFNIHVDIGVHQGNFYVLASSYMHEQTCCIYCSTSKLFLLGLCYMQRHSSQEIRKQNLDTRIIESFNCNVVWKGSEMSVLCPSIGCLIFSCRYVVAQLLRGFIRTH